MNHEVMIRIKHEFLDSLGRLLKLMSYMSYRDLEISQARIRDKTNANVIDGEDRSSLIKVKLIDLVLALRENNVIHEQKIKKILFSPNKRMLARVIAEENRAMDLVEYRRERREVEEKNKIMENDYNEKVKRVKLERAKLPFWIVFLFPLPMPRWPGYLPLPKEVPSLKEYESSILRNSDYAEVLIETVARFALPHAEIASEYMNEKYIRDALDRPLE
ncbi:hypothetical protein [Desulfurispira natronophila]|uniref:Uncharacterized protein n=1 Tax=Desulfurispira natronophila TaxID=682562 RepID=A0A7W8DGS0_9BACT|nr:hypothetical protein [Desulfurispira natronophila]MBB5021647.1 hypothetical protein [Desulfurispira natronophila]